MGIGCVVGALYAFASATSCINGHYGQVSKKDRVGCALNVSAVSRLSKKQSLESVATGNQYNQSLLMLSQTLNKWMGLSVSVYVIQDDNAFASPDGDVYLGNALSKRLFTNFDRITAWQGFQFVLMHEYAHQLQFEHQKSNESTPIMELQADILAGVIAGMFYSKQVVELGDNVIKVNADGLVKVAESTGDYAFNDPKHHGTPAQRRQASTEGINYGWKYKKSTPDAAFIDDRDEILAWSLEKAKSIFGTGKSR